MASSCANFSFKQDQYIPQKESPQKYEINNNSYPKQIHHAPPSEPKFYHTGDPADYLLPINLRKVSQDTLTNLRENGKEKFSHDRPS